MTTKTCGCAAETCGCCEGTRVWTPLSLVNRPGLDALHYRIGTHGTFFDTMKARLAAISVDGVGKDGQTIETFRPLDALTTRDARDPSIALLDGFATAADVLTFYQERIANEGYLRTATERRSVLELARLVGYTLRPGVAATVYLAYTLEDKQIDPVTIAAGARSQSVPGPDELPQSFETSEALEARAEWNNLQVRLTRPQVITKATSITIDRIFLQGVNTNLKKGDRLMLTFGEKTLPTVRIVQSVDTHFDPGGKPEANYTIVALQPQPLGMAKATARVARLFPDIASMPKASKQFLAAVLVDELGQALTMGLAPAPAQWAALLRHAADVAFDGEMPDALDEFIKKLGDEIDEALKDLGPRPEPKKEITSPDVFVNRLLERPARQVRSAQSLPRSLEAAFAEGRDLQPRLLLSFAPVLRDSYYTAWANAEVSDTPSPLKGIFVLRSSVPLFGATAAKLVTYVRDHDGGMKPDDPANWQDPPFPADEQPTALFLAEPRQSILLESLALIQRPGGMCPRYLVREITSAETGPRTAYGGSGNTTRLGFEQKWWDADPDTDMPIIRGTIVHAESEALALADEPILDDVLPRTAETRTEVELAGLYKELNSGRWIIFSGERADIPGVTGVKASELLMIAGLRHGYDPTLPGDKTHTTLILATAPQYSYTRNSLRIFANVVKATHGETRPEPLGSGDASQALQSFTLKQPPLTFVPAPTPSGIESTLAVYVNEVKWHEVVTLVDVKPSDHAFITAIADDDAVTVTFGNGEEGARLPTGVENVRAVYRNGIGRPGNVKAEQISLLQTRPIGVKEVINPLRASGGADRESRDQARENAPLAVMALDRLVSIRDYADFARTFAGIGKAMSRRMSDGHGELVHLTIAGADDIPIDRESDLFRNLERALVEQGDPALPLRIDLRELVVLILSANVRLQDDYLWEPVATKITEALLKAFGFHARAFGQPALVCEVVSVIQHVEGVAYVDVDAFGGVPERKADKDGTRILLTLSDLTAAVKAVIAGGGQKAVIAEIAGLENGGIRPAQLAIFNPDVPDTIVLNQIA